MRINWSAVAQHAAVGAIAAAVAVGLGFTAFGTPAVNLAFTALFMVGFGFGREVAQAAWRHEVALGDAARVVLDGEAGWSAWNLRLQALAWAVPPAMATLIAAAL